MDPKRRPTRITSRQIEKMVNFLMENQVLLHSKITTSCTKADKRALWDQLKHLLNSDPWGPMKSTEAWKKSWQDLKASVRQKAAAVAKAHDAAIERPKPLTLTPLEEKLMALIGWSNSAVPNVRLGETIQAASEPADGEIVDAITILSYEGLGAETEVPSTSSVNTSVVSRSGTSSKRQRREVDSTTPKCSDTPKYSDHPDSELDYFDHFMQFISKSAKTLSDPEKIELCQRLGETYFNYMKNR